jgi:hypothetical protein
MFTDAVGNIYVTGSRNLSVPQFTAQAVFDIFVTKLDQSGNILFTDLFSGKGSDQATAVTVDSTG